MFKQRMATALILAFGFVWVTTFSSSFFFALFISLIVLVASWEWGEFIGLKHGHQKIGYFSVVAFIIMSLFMLLEITPKTQSISSVSVSIILALGFLFWLITLPLLKYYPRNANKWSNKLKIAVMGILTLLPAWVGMVQLKYVLVEGYFVLGLVAMVAAVDSGAYFIGKQFGHEKLAPHLSPNKTWEGALGGFVLCLLVNLLLVWLLHNFLLTLNGWQIMLLVLLSFGVTFFDVIGDLFISMLKRNRAIKHSGFLLPGHGGVLDRIDGLIAVIPGFVLTVLFMVRGIE
ncbi:MAG: phosphatidate cytidylyltransferase [Pseudomonadota bacterium]|nr:phosphatidate cytidylyltransferase [Pseudomonadota bacterium]